MFQYGEKRNRDPWQWKPFYSVNSERCTCLVYVDFVFTAVGQRRALLLLLNAGEVAAAALQGRCSFVIVPTPCICHCRPQATLIQICSSIGFSSVIRSRRHAACLSRLVSEAAMAQSLAYPPASDAICCLSANISIP